MHVPAGRMLNLLVWTKQDGRPSQCLFSGLSVVNFNESTFSTAAHPNCNLPASSKARPKYQSPTRTSTGKLKGIQTCLLVIESTGVEISKLTSNREDRIIINTYICRLLRTSRSLILYLWVYSQLFHLVSICQCSISSR